MFSNWIYDSAATPVLDKRNFTIENLTIFDEKRDMYSKDQPLPDLRNI